MKILTKNLLQNIFAIIINVELEKKEKFAIL